MNIYETASWFLDRGCVVFGGYVRDYLLNVPPTDLDVHIPSFEKRGVIYDLGKTGPVEHVRVFDGEKYKGENFVHYRFLYGESKIQVDIILGEVIEKPDCDINKFELIKDGGKVNLRVRSGELGTVLRNLYCRKFFCEEGVSEKRIKKMLEKGFSAD